MLGINGVVTFKKSTLPEVLREVPLSRVVVETDSPYLAPTPYRGKRNESSYVVRVVEKLQVKIILNQKLHLVLQLLIQKLHLQMMLKVL